MPDKDLHKDHRDRLRKKLYSDDGDALEPHELLEVLLYSVYTQKDTNPIARALIKRFGTIYNVFEANPKELMSVPGVGKQTAAMLKLQSALLRRYTIDKAKISTNMQLTPKNSGEYIVNFFHGYSNETLMLFALDSECRIITSLPITKGTVDSVQAYVRDIVKHAMEARAVYVIIAHNHPNGTLTPSKSDIRFTMELEKALAFMNIRLIDHIIVSNEKFVSLANQFRIFNNRERT